MGDKAILITGGAGFVGSNVALHLKRQRPGQRVIALDNLKRRGSELNLGRLRDAGVDFVHGDVRHRSDLLALPTIGALVECSAEPSVLAGYGPQADYVVDTNLMGTVNCLALAARDKADVVFLSTSRVYPIDPLNAACEEVKGRFAPAANAPTGLSTEGISERFTLEGARTLYGATKLASELLLREYAAMHGFRFVVDRCGVIAGPWQMGKTDQGFVLWWLTRHHWGLPLKYIGFGGTGAQVRDVLHVNDVCALVELQLDDMNKVNSGIFNAGGGAKGAVSLKELSAICANVTGRNVEAGSDPATRPGDIKYYVTDNRKLTKATGWEPTSGVEDIVRDSYAWLKQHDAGLRVLLA
jgi:CDP-paratose 2-epimerase